MKKTTLIWLSSLAVIFILGLSIGLKTNQSGTQGGNTYTLGKGGLSFDNSNDNNIYFSRPKTQITTKDEAKKLLQIEDCFFMNISFSRKMKVIGNIVNSSSLVFKNVLLEANFYDTTGSILLYKNRFYIDMVVNSYEFEETIKLPWTIVKSDIGKVKVKVIDLSLSE